jgi:hypothetical protein
VGDQEAVVTEGEFLRKRAVLMSWEIRVGGILVSDGRIDSSRA